MEETTSLVSKTFTRQASINGNEGRYDNIRSLRNVRHDQDPPTLPIEILSSDLGYFPLHLITF
jgi:hypothetical protein